jgi:hypothetical protein
LVNLVDKVLLLRGNPLLSVNDFIGHWFEPDPVTASFIPDKAQLLLILLYKWIIDKSLGLGHRFKEVLNKRGPHSGIKTLGALALRESGRVTPNYSSLEND